MTHERLKSPTQLIGLLLIILALSFIGAFSTSSAYTLFPKNQVSLQTAKPCCLTNQCPCSGSGHHCQFSACRLNQVLIDYSFIAPKQALFFVHNKETKTPTSQGSNSPSLPPPIQLS